MKNDNFIEIDFCKECEHYLACNTSKYGLQLLEKFMIFSAISKTEEDVNKKFLNIFEQYNFTIEDVKMFVKNKEKNCIYFSGER